MTLEVILAVLNLCSVDISDYSIVTYKTNHNDECYVRLSFYISTDVSKLKNCVEGHLRSDVSTVLKVIWGHK